VPGNDSVKLRITPTGSPMPSPRRPELADIGGNGAASPEATASPLSGSAHSFEHLSQARPAAAFTLSQGVQGGRHACFRRLTEVVTSARSEQVSCEQAMTPRQCMQDLQQLGSPTYARVQGGLVPSPPSLPDLEALNPSEVQPAKHRLADVHPQC
jgi:hypothetical protein